MKHNDNDNDNDSDNDIDNDNTNKQQCKFQGDSLFNKLQIKLHISE